MSDKSQLEAARQAAERFLEAQRRADRKRSHAIFDADFLGGSGLTEEE